jgi:hypothetical protein
MASLQYIDLVGWTSAKQFWTEVVLRDYEQFMDLGNTRDAVHAALTAWHLHDWLFLEQHPSGGKKEKKIFQEKLIAACPELGWIRDYAETAKHRGLNRPDVKVQTVEPSRTVETTIPTPIGDFGSVSFIVRGKSPVAIVLLDDGTTHQLFDVLARVIDYWRANWFQ